MELIPKKRVLPNGLNLLTLSLPQLQSVTVMLMIKVGSRYESDNLAGISHFLEHLVFKGTDKYPTAFDLSSAVDSIGADFNAFTSKEYTGFYVKSALTHLDLSLDILSQLVCFPLLDEREMAKEKGVILEEIKMRDDLPMAKIADEFEILLYGLTHLGRPTIGYKDKIVKMKKQDFFDYRNKWYFPSNMVLGVVGGIDQIADLEARVFKYFNNFDCLMAKAKDLTKLTFKQDKPLVRLVKQTTQQAHLCLGVRSFPRGNKDRYVMAVLTTLLGGNMSSRLFTEIREKRGLAYYIKSDISTYFDHGYLVCQAGNDLGKSGEVIKLILAEMVKLKDKNGINQKELNKAKDYLKGKLMLALEDSKSLASFFVEDLLLDGKIRTLKQVVAGVEKVTVADLGRVSQAIFNNNGLNLAIIGPYQDQDRDKFEKLLKL